jgi:hypothetical protein
VRLRLGKCSRGLPAGTRWDPLPYLYLYPPLHTPLHPLLHPHLPAFSCGTLRRVSAGPRGRSSGPVGFFHSWEGPAPLSCTRMFPSPRSCVALDRRPYLPRH